MNKNYQDIKIKQHQLYSLCQRFIDKYEVSSPETIYQSDSVQLNVLELLEDICELIGYCEQCQE